MLKIHKTVVQHGFETSIGLNGEDNVKVFDIHRMFRKTFNYKLRNKSDTCQ